MERKAPWKQILRQALQDTMDVLDAAPDTLPDEPQKYGFMRETPPMRDRLSIAGEEGDLQIRIVVGKAGWLEEERLKYRIELDRQKRKESTNESGG